MTAAAGSASRRGGTGRPARPMVAVDTVLFALEQGRLRTWLVELSAGRMRGKWAFPGGLVRVGETLDGAARRELYEASGLGNPYLEQLYTFGDPARDPRAHVVSAAYMALIADPALVRRPPGKYGAGRWYAVEKLPPLAYDHAEMAKYALQRLRSKLAYTNLAHAMLPREFTFAQLQALYAAVIGRPIDRRNFRRRILAMGMLRRLPHSRRGAHRPAALYSFAAQRLEFIGML
ncbi:MAG: NUDIX hydrolase [Candidatus Binataceae bacterium]